jgi:hypothetical protein
MIRERLHIEPVLRPGSIGQFDVIVDGEKIAERGRNWFTRSLGAGYPDLGEVVEQLRHKQQTVG